jgi:hypothetical protein
LITDQLVQDEIRNNKATIGSFFEEVTMKIQRSHLLQAFLFDHIQPHMPSFNTNMFNMATNDNQNVQHLYQLNESSQVLLDELQKIETQHKKMKQNARKQNMKIQSEITSNTKSIKGSEAELEDRKKLENFKVDDNVNNKMDMYLFSK